MFVQSALRLRFFLVRQVGRPKSVGYSYMNSIFSSVKKLLLG
jgi:hypothetical protein